ncbi:hypothetical protein D9611_013184 [Ephemerocybe angulata]|uniref:Uncharacterized protein n=1 Tax=Ephemerocybe angulata TaxID=980116 RepID=A0A8H5BVM1_9AGAR|nr:hypothetical protein D9611_013184 [Tulosesus angulatus]
MDSEVGNTGEIKDWALGAFNLHPNSNLEVSVKTLELIAPLIAFGTMLNTQRESTNTTQTLTMFPGPRLPMELLSFLPSFLEPEGDA